MLDERRLQRVQRARRAEPFDGGDLAALVLHGQREAAVDALAVDQHRAGAAGALVAALLGAEQVQLLAQQIEQRGAHVHRDLQVAAIDVEAHGGLPSSPPSALNARMR